MQQFDKVTATFRPRDVSTLKAGAKAFIGLTAEFEAAWIIDHGPYKGEFAMLVPSDWRPRDFSWIPSGDLA